jgi:hypothetical protein
MPSLRCSLLILTLLILGSTSVAAQKDQFPLTAKVTASDSESVPTWNLYVPNNSNEGHRLGASAAAHPCSV